MKTRPILFSAEMVRAILDGRKTQTRRVVKQISPEWVLNPFMESVNCGVLEEPFPWRLRTNKRNLGRFGVFVEYQTDVDDSATSFYPCPYGAPGDRLWVRETWATHGNYDHIKPSELGKHPHSGIVYRATEQHGDAYFKWRPSIFMPRWASRLTLDLLDVQVERLWQMTVFKMLDEGVAELPDEDDRHPLTPFIELWDSINAKRGFDWQSNPWVWVLRFEVCNEGN